MATLTPLHTPKLTGFTGGLVALPKPTAFQNLTSSQPKVWRVVTVPSAAAPCPHDAEIFGTPVWDCDLLSVHLARTQAMEFCPVL